MLVAVTGWPYAARKPARQLGYRGVQPSSALALALDAPRDSVAIMTMPSPAISFANHSGKRRGGLAPTMRATRVSLVSPYTREADAAEHRFFETAGF